MFIFETDEKSGIRNLGSAILMWSLLFLILSAYHAVNNSSYVSGESPFELLTPSLVFGLSFATVIFMVVAALFIILGVLNKD
ncbi:MAG: hypothetical protein GF334_03145 [Candidatus Altiarchaeales archaeon]|nr:hypothetical protein [Candidatus Altiarchaeales archaeon]